MQKPWFRLNKWKTGWIPVSWQGWSIMLIYFATLIYDFITIDQTAHSVSDTIRPFLIHTLILTVILSIICYFTAEKSAEILP